VELVVAIQRDGYSGPANQLLFAIDYWTHQSVLVIENHSEHVENYDAEPIEPKLCLLLSED